MTHVAKMLIDMLEKWFGPYDDDERSVTAQYIDRRGITQAEAGKLYAVLIEEVPREYKRPPSVGKLSPYVRQIIEQRPPVIYNPPALPEPNLDREDGERILAGLREAMESGRNPGLAREVWGVLEKYGHGVESNTERGENA